MTRADPAQSQGLILHDGSLAREARRGGRRYPPTTLGKSIHARHAQRAADTQPVRHFKCHLAMRSHPLPPHTTNQQKTHWTSRGQLVRCFLMLMNSFLALWERLRSRVAMNTSIHGQNACAEPNIDLAQPWRSLGSAFQVRLALTREQEKRMTDQYFKQREQAWKRWQEEGLPWVIIEHAYGAYRQPGQPRSHSSESDASVGRWLMRGLNPNHSPSPPRRSRSRQRARPSTRPPRDMPTRTQPQQQQQQPAAEDRRPIQPQPPAEEADHSTQDDSPSGSRSRSSLARRGRWDSESPTPEPQLEYSPPSQNTYEAERLGPIPLFFRDAEHRLVMQLYWLHDGGRRTMELTVTEPFPITPAKVERMIREQYPRVAGHGRRFLLARSFERGLVRIIPPDEPCIRNPETQGPFTVHYEEPYGGDDLGIVMRMIKQSGKLNLLADHKVIKTTLNAQPKLVPRLIAACNDDDRRNMLISPHLLEAMSSDASVVMLQETGLTSRSQNRLRIKAQKAGWDLLCGEPAPVTRVKTGSWRADKTAAPGVAILAKERIHIGTVKPKTPSGNWMYRKGRFLLAFLGLASEQTLLGVVYFPTGTSKASEAERATYHDALLTEVAAWRQIPILLAGDWNTDLSNNPTAAVLAAEGWIIPPLCHRGQRAVRTFSSPTCTSSGGTILDYWLASRHFQNLQRQEVADCPRVGHAQVALQIPRMIRSDRLYMVGRRWTELSLALTQIARSNGSSIFGKLLRERFFHRRPTKNAKSSGPKIVQNKWTEVSPFNDPNLQRSNGP